MAILMAWAAIAGLVAAAGLDTVGSAVRTVLIAALVATAVVLLLRSAIACAVGLATPLALTLVALSTVLPEYAADVYFAWAAAGHTEGPNAATVLAAMTGASQLLVGLAWPLVIVLSGVGRGGQSDEAAKGPCDRSMVLAAGRHVRLHRIPQGIPLGPRHPAPAAVVRGLCMDHLATPCRHARVQRAGW